MPDDKEYIGDGVFVSFEWGDLKLETERDGITHWIVLGPREYQALLAYIEATRTKVDR